jgi:thiol-disulfide isomerase/thioredoxin
MPLSYFRTLRTNLIVWLLLLMGGAALLVGCGAKSEPAVAETKKFRPADAADPPVTSEFQSRQGTLSSAANDIRRVDAPGGVAPKGPSGDPPGPSAKSSQVGGELQATLEQLDRLAMQQPKGNSQQEQLEDLVRIHNQRLSLAKKALQLKPPAEVRQRIVMAMYEIYQAFVQLRLPGTQNQLAEFAKSMMADSDPEVARIGRHAQFGAALARITSQPLENGKEVAAEAKRLLDAERGNLSEATLELVGQIADMLTASGLKEDGAAIAQMLADTLASDSKLADRAPRYALVAKFIQADLDALMDDVIREKPGADKKILATVQGLLKDVPPSRELFQVTQGVAHNLESIGSYGLAQSCYDQISAAFQNVSDERLGDAKKLASRAKRRMELIGKPLAVEGVMVDGRPFDWAAYAGKVVLVDFWATWCGPCLEELPNIRQNFEQFHAKGFEVVGVNLNTSASDLKQFLTLQDLPWASVTSREVLDGTVKDEDWAELPMAARCGVDAIPFVALVGKDGNVDSIHVRGPKLKKRLTELLGEPLTTEIPADPTQPGAPRALPAAGKQSNVPPVHGAATPVAMLVAAALFAADPPEAAASDKAEANPYLAKPDLSSAQLVAYIQRMLDRPQAIQTRPGFAEAIVEAADRILVAQPPAAEKEQLVAIESKFSLLHREACDGKEWADKQLMAFVEQLKDDSRPQVASEVAFFRLERQVLEAKDLPLEQIPILLNKVKEFAGKEKLTAKHLRLASSTVAAINRLEDGDEREAQFATLGALFSKSGDKELAQYGKKLAKKPAGERAAAKR